MINIFKLKTNHNKNSGFTLIELLVTISIIMVLSTIALFGIGNAQESGRNAKRRADLENIRTALELFYSDCNQYPAAVSNRVPSPLASSNANCPGGPNATYMTQVPSDPSANSFYYYDRTNLNSFVLCTHLEGAGNTAVNGCPSGANTCGTGRPCNYIVAGP